jgi:hypothetical protein
MTEYLVVDYDTGAPPNQVEADLNGYGVDGWEVRAVDLTKSNKRRVIFIKASTMYAPEAPADGVTYGRKDNNWNPVLPLTGGTMTGAIALPGDPVNPTDAADKNYIDGQISSLGAIYLNWVPYTGPPQSFAAQDMTRDGDWTMVSIRATSDRPAPQPSGPELDLLPSDWTPAQQNIRATFTVMNEFTVNTAGWIDQYGVDVNPQNVGTAHAISLQINGVARDSFTSKPSVAGMNWVNITPLLVAAGSVLRVTVQVSQIANQLMYYDEQIGLFATPPTYCSLAQGSFNNGPFGANAYDCHVLFIPGSYSPDWEVVAFGGTAAAGGTDPTTITTEPMTVAQLPPGIAGTRAFVTDANAATFNSIVAGGGTNGVPVFSDGTNWRIG